MTPWLSDPDVDIHVGDALDVLRGLPDGSVDCCVTSPPYWGLRDYGTGAWDGGNPDFRDPCPDCSWPNPEERTFRNPDHCDTCLGARTVPHRAHDTLAARGGRGGSGAPGKQTAGAFPAEFAADVCRCGARRVDRQLGLEATPDLYVAAMVAVFAEVRRVLADHGTLWLNIGSSYASGTGSGLQGQGGQRASRTFTAEGMGKPVTPGFKPKDMVPTPWMLAMALQQDGWYLRADIIWSKPNPMPESVTDRPTKAHEYVFLLSKAPRYWYDGDAIREPRIVDGTWNADATSRVGWEAPKQAVDPSRERTGIPRRPDMFNPAGRNVRSVWEIATQPYPEAHFATFPEELPRRAILAGCPEAVCSVCGKARERIVEYDLVASARKPDKRAYPSSRGDGSDGDQGSARSATHVGGLSKRGTTLGWSDCGHNAYRPGRVLDPFLGSGTTAHVARKHGRRCVGIELNETYAQLAARRLQQLSLLADGSSY